MPHQNKYLFYIAKIYSITIFKPLVEVADQLGIDFRFYVSEKVRINFPIDWDESKILTDCNSAIKYNSTFVLCSGNYIDHRIPGVKVQIFHGLGVEKDVHYAIRHFFDIYLTSGPYVTKKFMILRDLNKKYFDVFETGWPKVDYIINFEIEKINFQFPSNKKIILYAPTFSSKMESSTDLIDVIPHIIGKDEYWFIKFHELMPKDKIEIFKSQLPENVQLIPSTEDITPYLHISDIMISDTSSVIYEFLILKKPVISYRTIDLMDKCYNITEKNKLRSSLDLLLSNPNFPQENIEQSIERVNPRIDGKISTAIIELLNSIDPANYPKANKPLNLIRKIKNFYYSIFKKGYLK